MKKLALLLIISLLIPSLTHAKKKPLREFKDVYLFAQSGRNSDKKGSALSLVNGITYSLRGANDNTYTKYIDVMLYYGKTDQVKEEVFHLFAPEDPTLNIDWNTDGGTKPYNKFIGKSDDDEDIYFALSQWKTRNFTKLQLIDDVDFDTATAEEIKAMPIKENYIISNVKIGDVILFELAETSPKKFKKGLIKVKMIEDDPTKPDKSGNKKYARFTLDIKLLKKK